MVLNAVITYNKVEGDCTAGIRKEHLDPATGAFVDNATIEIGTNGLQTTSAIASKTYVDETIAFGTLTNRDADTNYVAATDGFFIGTIHAGSNDYNEWIVGKINGTAIMYASAQTYYAATPYNSFCLPVKVGEKN